MGLKFSADKVLGWRTQYDVMLRWFERCKNVHHTDGRYTSFEDALDFILVFFIYCYHLSDYVVETGSITRPEIDKLIEQNKNMQICRDICLRVKHHNISQSRSVKKSLDKDFSIGREYSSPYSPAGENLFLILDGEKLDPLSIVHNCVNFWQDLVDKNSFKEPPNPFQA
jgi:hypothetical protein